MRAMKFIDFGSTFTKITAIDVENAAILGCAQAFTTVGGIGVGLHEAEKRLEAITGPIVYEKTLACSSAAGGLSIVAIGLVPSLTEKAARLACFGAGAKVLKSYSFELTEGDVAEIEGLAPDLLLLTGGIDGGNSKAVLHNAKMLSHALFERDIIVAGNRAVASRVAQILRGKKVEVCENVMPAFGVLNLEPVKEKIRSLFLSRMAFAKGLDQNQVLMPTPAAVMEALKTLSSSWGDLMAIDLGGAPPPMCIPLPAGTHQGIMSS